MIFQRQPELSERIEQCTGRKCRGNVPIFEDTTLYLSIQGGSVLRIGGNDYFVLGDAREGRFGLDDEPKFWVKHVVDLGTGARKVVKLVFDEQFTITLGGVRMHRWRSPQKETAFLEAVRGDPHFMQGVAATDAVGNVVRIIDFVEGENFFAFINDLAIPHETYFFEMLPKVMERLIPCIAALAPVHRLRLRHGDLRNDHIIIEGDTGIYTWIDFDYEVDFASFDVWCLGNVIVFAVGKGLETFSGVRKHPEWYPRLTGPLDEADAMVLFPHRIANLRKLYPYVPPELNDILLRFSPGKRVHYDDVDSVVNDLAAVFGYPNGALASIAR